MKKIAFLVCLLAVVSCTTSCKTMSGTDLKNAAVDCTISTITSNVAKLEPFAFALLGALTRGDGTVDWGDFAKTIATLGLADGVCLIADMQSHLRAPASQPATASIPPGQLVQNVVDGLERIREQNWPGVKVRTAQGLQ